MKRSDFISEIRLSMVVTEYDEIKVRIDEKVNIGIDEMVRIYDANIYINNICR